MSAARDPLELCPDGCGLPASETNPHRLVTYTLAELMRLTDEQLDQLESLSSPLEKGLWWEITRLDRRLEDEAA